MSRIIEDFTYSEINSLNEVEIQGRKYAIGVLIRAIELKGYHLKKSDEIHQKIDLELKKLGLLSSAKSYYDVNAMQEPVKLVKSSDCYVMIADLAIRVEGRLIPYRSLMIVDSKLRYLAVVAVDNPVYKAVAGGTLKGDVKYYSNRIQI